MVTRITGHWILSKTQYPAVTNPDIECKDIGCPNTECPDIKAKCKHDLISRSQNVEISTHPDIEHSGIESCFYMFRHLDVRLSGTPVL